MKEKVYRVKYLMDNYIRCNMVQSVIFAFDHNVLVECGLNDAEEETEQEN